VLGVIGLAPATALAFDFERERVQGIVNFDVSYGVAYRLDRPDDALVGIANGGTATTVNGDDGELNQKHGLASQMVRATGEAILAFDNFGLYVRGAAFDDWVLDGHLDRTRITPAARDLVGSDAQLLEHYLAWSVPVGGTPVYFRVGDQVLSWQGTAFVRDGLDLINPFDAATSFQPAARAQDNRQPQGMVWVASSLTDVLAVEGYYQYKWKPVQFSPVGTLFSPLDLYGGDGVKGHGAFLGAGRISDLGTNLDAQFDLPNGTLGFDRNFDRIPGRGVDRAPDGGEYGVSAIARFFDGYATKLGVHYIRYHSRLPIISGLTGGAAAIAGTSDAAVTALADSLEPIYAGEGLDSAAAATAAKQAASALTLSNYMNQAGYIVEFPKNIDMVGASFSFSSLRTGTLVSGEFAHHFDFPYQLDTDAVIGATLSPVLFDPNVGATGLGEFGPNAIIHGYYRADRTQAAIGARQLLGPRGGATQVLIDVDAAWVHVHDLPNNGAVPLQRDATANSWGYRVVVAADYNSLFGAISMTPRLVYGSDAHGTTPAPTVTFLEGRRVLSIGANFDYLQRIDVDLAYTQFSGGGQAGLFRDRDFAQARATFYF
jgi:hypothetical protein